jgi:hypothetical protein
MQKKLSAYIKNVYIVKLPKDIKDMSDEEFAELKL